MKIRIYTEICVSMYPFNHYNSYIYTSTIYHHRCYSCQGPSNPYVSWLLNLAVALILQTSYVFATTAGIILVSLDLS